MTTTASTPKGVDFAIAELEYRLWQEAIVMRLPDLPFEDRREFSVVRSTGMAVGEAGEVYVLTVKLEHKAR